MIDKSLRFLKVFIENNDPIATKLETRYPFRALFYHCYRTYKWAQRINLFEKGDQETVELAALFHDAGKCVDRSREGHALAGANICSDFLKSEGFDPQKTHRIAGLVRNHICPIDNDTASVEQRVLKDADMLDEVGAMTVLWDSMATAAQDGPSYMKAYRRIRQSYTDLEHKKGTLATSTGIVLFGERISMLERFLEDLRYELGLDNDDGSESRFER